MSTNSNTPFYTHEDRACGDFIPFYDLKTSSFHLFYICGNPWYHISTKDFVDFTYHGIAIPAGNESEQDLCVYTGCVCEKDDRYYIYYTGHNDALEYSEVILRATSSDLITWKKDSEFSLKAPAGYSKKAWRDPHVFFDGVQNVYRMVLTASKDHSPWRRWGTTVMFTSTDMLNWQFAGDLYAPNLNDSHECPDLFKIGDWYYLIFSTYSKNWETKYRMAKSLSGPWICPADELFDGRAFYAAKSVTDGNQRHLIGWESIKEDGLDKNTYQWSGCLMVHTLHQRPDGTLYAAMPETVEQAFDKRLELNLRNVSGNFDQFYADAMSSFAYLELGKMKPETEYLLKGRIRFDEECSAAGLMLRTSDRDFSLEHYYQLRMEPKKQRFSFLRSDDFFFNHHFIEERPFRPDDSREASFKVILSGSVISIYVGEAALSVRGYDLKDGGFGFFVEEGRAELLDIEIYGR